MKNRFKIIIVLTVLVLAISSCTSIDIESQINDKVVSMTPLPDTVEHKIVGSFSEDMRVFFTINGLVTVSHLKVDETIRNAVERYHGDGVVNFKVNDQFSGIDILIQSGLSLGGYLVGCMVSPDVNYAAVYGSLGASAAQFCLQSRTVTISGDVFKME